MVFHFGISALQYLKMSAIRRREGFGGKMYVRAGDVLLQHVVLDRAGELVGADALLFRDELVEQQQEGGGRVDGHRRGHLVQRDAAEQHPHVVDRVDGDTDLADLAVRDRRVGVVAHLGRQVEGDGEAHGAVGDELLVARVRLDGGAEAGVLPHGPRAAGVHRRVDASGVRERTRLAQLLCRVPPVEGIGPYTGSMGSPDSDSRAMCLCLPVDLLAGIRPSRRTVAAGVRPVESRTLGASSQPPAGAGSQHRHNAGARNHPPPGTIPTGRQTNPGG